MYCIDWAMVYTIPIRPTHNSMFITNDQAYALCIGYTWFNPFQDVAGYIWHETFIL